MDVAGRFLGISEDGPPLVGILVQGSGRSMIRWFAPLDGPQAAEWAQAFAPGAPVVCDVVLDEQEQRMRVKDIRPGPPGGETAPR